MKQLLFSAIVASAVAIAPAAAQSLERMATFNTNTVADTGKCTVEVIVPGTAQVRIKGDKAELIKMSGRDPEWRKFECTSQMPKKPEEFRVETKGGRGEQVLEHGPRGHGGTAVVNINDKGKGEDVYSFEIIWGVSPNQR